MDSNYFVGQYCIIRTFSAGVHCGIVKSIQGQQVILAETRRIWQWEKAFTLSSVAINGIGEKSLVSIQVPTILLTEAIEIIPCSEKAEKNLREFVAHNP